MVQTLPLKIALVGDSLTGKTSLQYCFIRGHTPEEHILNGLETVAKVVTLEGEKFSITVVDTNGSPNTTHDKIRPLSYYYPSVDLFLVCYSIIDGHSFENITTKWIPETRKHCPKAKIFIVGTKQDLREKVPSAITEKEGRRLAESINACGFQEVSSKSTESVSQLFNQAVNISKTKFLEHKSK